MANDKDFIVKNAVEVGGSTKTTLGTITSNVQQTSYDIANASYDNKSFDASSQAAATADGVHFKSDGTKMYVMSAGNNAVYQYSLSTAWDVTTASYDSVSLSVSSQDTGNWRDIDFSHDGSTLYGLAGSGVVYQYDLSTSWDLSTASYASKSFDLSTYNTPQGIFVSSDSTKLILCSSNTSAVYTFTFSTAKDVSTLSYDSDTKSLTSEDSGTVGVSMNNTGTKMFILGSTNDTVFQYTLSTAYDVSTASYDSKSFDASDQETGTDQLFFSQDGLKMYIIADEVVYQYSTATYADQIDLDTGNYFNDTLAASTTYTISNAGDVQSFQLEVTGGAVGYQLDVAAYDSKSFSVTSQETSPRAIAFKTDGTKVYVVGNSSDTIYQYSLSTAWDVSTASYDSVSFSTSSQEGYPTGLVFKSDGLKMFLMGQGNARVYSYTLSTAWDVSTASYDSVFLTVSSQVTTPRGLSIKSDGTVMVIGDNADNDAHQYTLSTGWDLSTASYASKTFTFSGFSTYGHLFVNPDGTKLFALDAGSNEVVKEFELSTAWDISTASSTGNSLDVTSQDGTMHGMVFKPDGTKLYMLGNTGDNIYQYSTSSDATITWPSSIEWAGGVAPAATAGGETDLFTLSTDDGGTTYQGFKTADNLS